MKQAKVKWTRRRLKVRKILDETGKSKNQIEKLISTSVSEAEKMSKVGNNRIQNILSLRRNTRVPLYN